MTTRVQDAVNESAFKDKAAEVGEDLRDMATIAADAGRKQVKKIREAATEQYEEARERITGWEEVLEAYVRERPIKALVIAGVVGLVIAKFARRR